MISIRDGEMYKSETEDYCRWVGHVGKIYVRTPAHKRRHCHIFEARLLIIDYRFWDNSFCPLANLKRVKFIKEPIRGGFSNN